MYETMAVWETDPAFAAESELMANFADVWQDTDKVVYSTTLTEVATARTRIEQRFDADAVRAMKASAASDLFIAGPNLAAQAFHAGLVDECHIFVCPLLVGDGKPAFPTDLHMQLELVDERRFDNDTMHLHYRVGVAPLEPALT